MDDYNPSQPQQIYYKLDLCYMPKLQSQFKTPQFCIIIYSELIAHLQRDKQQQKPNSRQNLMFWVLQR